MKTFARILGLVLCVAPLGVAHAAVVATNAGDNLTAFNGNVGATNNNRWNTLMNSRTGGNTAVADFGNCNAVIMRCAQPKCANGGCTDMVVTSSIVSGCVQSNAACKQYGDELIQYISAQLVANSTAKANEAANAAQTAAANAAAQQNAQQMAMMQQQMQQMQAEMAAQNAQTVAQLQSALDEQKQLTANAIAEATAAREATTPVATATATTSATQSTSSSDLTSAQINAAQNGVSADVLAREQITGQIMSAIENAEVQLKTLKATMQDVFTYAGCDSRGNNCTGPKRVKTFKHKAENFFDPYENVLDELYDALVLAQSVGVDITDIYMMLNGSCNVWGQYLCNLGEGEGECKRTKTVTTNVNGKSESYQECIEYAASLHFYDENNCPDDTKSKRNGFARGGHECNKKGVIPPEDDISCTLNKTIVDDPQNPVQRDWLWAESNTASGANIRVGCASSALESSTLFRNRKKQATIDIETLQKIIAQDAPTFVRANKNDLVNEQVKYCALTEKTYTNLQKLVTTKTLPTKDICINESKLNKNLSEIFLIDSPSIIEMARNACNEKTNAAFSDLTYRCYCEQDSDGNGGKKEECNKTESERKMAEAEKKLCEDFEGASWSSSTRKCNCDNIQDSEDKARCKNRFEGIFLNTNGYTTGGGNNFNTNVSSTNFGLNLMPTNIGVGSAVQNRINNNLGKYGLGANLNF